MKGKKNAMTWPVQKLLSEINTNCLIRWTQGHDFFLALQKLCRVEAYSFDHSVCVCVCEGLKRRTDKHYKHL